VKDLHILPKIRDSWSFLYVERCRIEQHEKAIAVETIRGKVPVPCAMLTTLMLGPGSVITHAAVRALADNGCLVIWCGEDNIRFYAQGMGETRSAANLYLQARLWADPERRQNVVRRLYEMRFKESLSPDLNLRQVRGMEGIRVRRAYAEWSRETGVSWKGRAYKSGDWYKADAINRALSAANSCLYGVCHAAIVSAGFSSALGFIHTGKMLSFVYDVADLYKTEVSIPAAFRAVSQGSLGVESRARAYCREDLVRTRLLARIVPDIQVALGMQSLAENKARFDEDDGIPGGIWDEIDGEIDGGVNYADLDDAVLVEAGGESEGEA